MKRVSKIQTETNCIHLDNTLIPKGSMTVLKQTDGVILNYIAKTGYIYILAKGTTIDGEEFDLDFLFNFFINNGFLSTAGGGGSIPIDQNYNATSTNAQSGTAVAQALATLEIPNVSQTYDATSTDAISGQGVAKALENVVTTDNINTSFIDNFENGGADVTEEVIVGTQNTTTVSNFSALSNTARTHYNFKNIAEKKGNIKQIVINCATAGNITLVVGTHNYLVAEKFNTLRTLGTYALSVGLNTITLNENIEANEIIAIQGGTAIVTYGNYNGYDPDNFFISAYTSADTLATKSATSRAITWEITFEYIVSEGGGQSIEDFLDNRYTTKLNQVTADISDGKNAVQLALNKITDATEKNRYQINVNNGIYKLTNGADFIANPTYPAQICPIDHVDIIGQSPSSTILWAELPFNDDDLDEVATTQTRARFQSIYNWADDVLIKNITFVSKNIRYVLHQDNNQEVGKSRTYENCNFIFFGTKGYRFAFGIGTYSGSKTYVKGGKTSSPERASFSIHNNINFSLPSLWSFENHYFENISGQVARCQAMLIKNSGSMQDCTIELFNCSSNQFIINYATEWLYRVGSNDTFNYANWRIVGNGNSPFFFSNEVLGGSLMFESAEVGKDIRFDTSLSGYSLLIKNPFKYWGNLGHPDREIFNSEYIVQDSTTLTKGKAFGCVSILEGTASNNVAYQCSLGIRLGDCTTSFKNLSVIVGDETVNIQFNKNYTTMSNSDIIAEINTALDGKAICSQHSIGQDYYAELNDVLTVGISGYTDQIIEKGTLVTMKNNRLLPCGADDELYGLLIDDLAPYVLSTIDGTQKGKGRVIKNCYITNQVGKIQSVKISGTGNRYTINDGAFIANASGKYILNNNTYILI